ncbi:putative uncharacterized protein [Eubacterium sp. CAG:786]|nr:putative uncharacterized protein [Eubacterium sp. CAG:786]
MSEYIDKSEAVGEGYLQDWYISSVSEDDEPVWTEAHIEELTRDFIVIPKDTPAADVAPVVHAYWIYQKPYDEYTWRPYICSSCKTHGGKHRTNYCQSCGAKMDLCPPKRDKNGGDTDV